MSINNKDYFKKSILDLFEIFEEMVEEAQDEGIIQGLNIILIACKVVLKSRDPDKMCNNFIKKTYQYWDKIFEKDAEYFKKFALEQFNSLQGDNLDKLKEKEGDGSDFVKNLTGGHLENFKDVLSGTYIDDGEVIYIFDEDRQRMIWGYLHNCVKHSILYIKNQPCKDIYKNIDIHKYSKIYKIKI